MQPWPRCELTILDQNGHRLRGIEIESRPTLIPVAADLDGDGKSDLLFPCNEDRRMHALANDGRSLWSFRPYSHAFKGAKMKGGGVPLVADLDGDGLLEVVTGDDETVLNCIRTETRVKPLTVIADGFQIPNSTTK